MKTGEHVKIKCPECRHVQNARVKKRLSELDQRNYDYDPT